MTSDEQAEAVVEGLAGYVKTSFVCPFCSQSLWGVDGKLACRSCDHVWNDYLVSEDAPYVA